jgi:hypothetical protein
MVGRIPLMHCFLDGNMTATIPHKYSKYKNFCFLASCTDAAAEDGRSCSKVYEVNPHWMRAWCMAVISTTWASSLHLLRALS